MFVVRRGRRTYDELWCFPCGVANLTVSSRELGKVCHLLKLLAQNSQNSGLNAEKALTLCCGRSQQDQGWDNGSWLFHWGSGVKT